MTALPVSAAIEQRRAIKWYDPNHEMSAAEFRTLLQHAILSPIAYRLQSPALALRACQRSWLAPGNPAGCR